MAKGSVQATIDLKALLDVSQVKGAVGNIQKALSGLTLPKNIGNNIQKSLQTVEQQFAKIEQLQSKGFGGLDDANDVLKASNIILKSYDDIAASVRQLGTLSDKELQNLFPITISDNIKKAETALKNYRTEIKLNIAEQDKLQKVVDKAQKALDQKKNQLSGKSVVDDAIYKENEKQKRALEKQLVEQVTARQQYIDSKTWKTPTSWKSSGTVQKYDKEISQLESKLQQLRTLLNSQMPVSVFDKLQTKIKEAENELQLAKKSLNDFLSTKPSETALNKLFTELQKIDGVDLSSVTRDLAGAEKVIEGLSANQVEQLRAAFDKLGIELDSLGPAFKDFGDDTQQAGDKTNAFKQEVQELAQFKSRLLDFFGINNAINLFQRAIRDAYDTVRELDAAMTETAVVTDFSVSDMWDQLPRYTEEANKLGATTLGAYETMTLYYQQGLEANEAFALGTETMKMARIANMEYADATEMMTAAIRGFNMALNETSAQRVNDVYSELAAITAADTEQIATAMTKTASIANSANMEFETTAALLSQIIETTQEAPETAGTAMKTIIARFTEVKQLFSQGQLTGKDSEGEVININKIDEALKSVGMSLQGFLRGEEGIDDIFLELASKWDTLDLSTQRYIATMAAGSRQQSRFIAMMSDYERTMELVSAANNSAGASQKQFDKTLDSLEAKLNKLKNAWDQFTMGLANNSLIKAGVDTLTTILTLANNLTKVFGGGLLGSIVKVGLAIKGLSLGKMGVTGLGSLMGKAVKTKQGSAVYKALGLETLLGKITDEDKESGGITTGQKIVSSGSTFAGIITNAANTFRNIITGAAVEEKVAKVPQQLSGLGESIKEGLFGTRNNEVLSELINDEVIDSGGKNTYSQLLSDNRNLLGGLLPKLGLKAADLGFGKKMAGGKFATFLAKQMGLGSLTTVTGGGAAAAAGSAAAGLAGLAATLGVIGAAAAIAIPTVKALYNLTPEGQLKQAEKLADTIGEVADKASQQANEIKGLYDAYQTNQQAIKDTSNLDEYREAINASNEQIMQMMESHPDLITGDMIEFQDGQIILDSDAFSAAVDRFEAAANNLRFDDTYAQANELYKRADVYKEEADVYSLQIEENREDNSPYEQELIQARELALLNERSIRTQADALAASAYYNLIGDAVKEAGYGDALASAVAEAWGANEEAQIEFRRSQMDESTIAKEFERITGLSHEGYTRDYMKDTIAMDQFREARDSSLLELENLFLSNQKSMGTLLEFLDGTYKGKLAGQDLEEVDGIASLLDLGDLDLEKVAELLQFKDSQSFLEYFNQQNQEYERMRSALRQELYTSLFSYADKTSSPINLETIQGLDIESQERMKSFMDAIQHFSDEGKGAAWSFMPEIVQDADEFASIVDSIDFQNPIAMARDLQNILEDETHFAHDFAEALWNSESQFLSLQSQLKYLMSSEGYAGVIEQVEELIDVNGELTGDDIEELADDCQELRDMLDESTLSAEALAKALTQIELGELSVDQLTDDVLQALSSVQELDQFFRNGESMRENFDEGRDYAEGYEWLSDLFEELQENVNNYEFGNERTVNLAKALFGEDAFKSIDTAYNRQNPEAYFAAYQSQIARFSELMENNGEGFAKALVDARILSTDGEKYEFNQELTGNMSTVVDEIAKALNIGTEGAQMLWENYLAHDRDLTVKYQEGLVAEATEAFKDSKITDNELYATADEIDAMAKALAMTPQQIEDFKASLKEAGIAVVDWSNQTGKDILNSLDKIFGDNTKKKLQDSLISKDGINYHQAISELSKYGIFGEQADSVITEMAQITGEAITATVKFWDGEQIAEKQLKMGEDEKGNPIEETLQSFLARVAETQTRETQEAAIAATTAEGWEETNSLLSQILSALVLLNPDSEESKAAEASEGYLSAAEAAAAEVKAANNAEEAAEAVEAAKSAAEEARGVAGQAKEQGLLNADVLEEQARQAENIAEEAARAAQKYNNEVEVPHLISSTSTPAFTEKDRRKEKYVARRENEHEYYTDLWTDFFANDPSIPPFLSTPQDAEDIGEAVGETAIQALVPVMEKTISEEDKYVPEVKETKEETVPLENISSNVESVVTNTGETTASVTQLANTLLTNNPTEKGYSSTEATTKKEKIEAKELNAEVIVDTAKAQAQLDNLNTDNLKAKAEETSTTLTTAVTEGVTDSQADLDSLNTIRAQVSAQQLGSSIASSASAGAGAAQSYINSIQGKTVYINVITNKQTKNAAAGGIVPSYASGSANRKIESGMALTGEEDPEIIWNKEQGYAYIAGENGPEFNHLQPGDRVFNAQETKEIFRRSSRSAAKGGIISAAAGWGAPESEGGSSGGGSGSRSGSKENKPSEWKNEFDWLYNLVEDIVELERERNKIVEHYQDLLEDNNATAQDLVNATVDELKNLYGQQARQQSVYEKRQQEMNDYLAHYSQYAAYGGYNFEDQTVEINWDAIEAIQDEDYYGDVKEYVEGLEEIQDKMDEADDALLDINNEIQEIEERFLEAYTSFENRVLDAIVNLRQKEIDELSNINSTIKDTNSRLFDAVQKSLSLQRQDRENAKTEEEIAKKERRLAFLRQDTSNDNTISIRELEKELDELKEDYTDELIDQKLDFLQDQEDFAAEQRERQIELMESQLAFEQETGQLWAQVEDLIMNAMGPDGKLLEGSELVSILQAGETWESLSAAQQKVWQDTLIGEFNEALAYLLFEKTDLSVIKETTFNEAMNDIITELQNVSKSIANIKFTYSDSGGGSGGSSGGAVGGGQPVTQPISCQGNCTGICMSGCTGSCSAGCYGDCKHSCSVGCKTSCYQKCTTSCHSGCKGSSSYLYQAVQQKFATGGYTGDWSGNDGKLAMLHKKELILNAKDTANFIELKEVLASGTLDALSAINPANTSNISGDTYIDITVEAELKNDYDVEQLTKKIKSEIYKDGSYRGVNVIHKIR